MKIEFRLKGSDKTTFEEITNCTPFLVEDKVTGTIKVAIILGDTIAFFSDNHITYANNETARGWLIKNYKFIRMLDEDESVEFTGGSF